MLRIAPHSTARLRRRLRSHPKRMLANTPRSPSAWMGLPLSATTTHLTVTWRSRIAEARFARRISGGAERSVAGAKGREEDHVADRFLPGQHHHEAVDA